MANEIIAMGKPLPRFPRYRATSDGHVFGFDPVRAELYDEQDSLMPEFWDTDRGAMMVVLHVDQLNPGAWPPRQALMPQVVPLAMMVAEAYAERELEVTPLFRDRDPTNCALPNLNIGAGVENVQSFRCPHCDFTTIRKSALTNHLNRNHPELIGKVTA